MARLDQVPGIVAWALSWAATGLVLGLIAGVIVGVLAANFLANAAIRTAEQGGGVARPLVTVPVGDAASEETAYRVLKSVGVYEIARRAR
jgi:hypothetical protein